MWKYVSPARIRTPDLLRQTCHHYTPTEPTVAMDEIGRAISYYVTKITRSHHSTGGGGGGGGGLNTLRIN